MKLTIGQFNDSFPPIIDGVANVVLNYARCLNNEECYCCVITPKHPDAEDNYGFDVFRFASMKVPTRGEYRFGIPQMSTSFWMGLKKIPFDIVHAHSPFSSGAAARSIARKRNIPFVTTFHSKYKDDFKAAIKSDIIVDNIIQKIVAFYESADEVWAVSEGSVETLREYGYHGPVHVMENGCDIEPQYRSEESDGIVNKALNIPAELPVFVYVGQHIWQKNLKMVIESLKIVKEHGFRFRMLCVGDGPQRPAMKKMARDLGLKDDVMFTGKVASRDMLAKIYLRSSALLFPSYYDTSGLVSKEAAACGCPTVFAKGASIAAGITEKNGFLTENSAQALAAVVERIIQNPAEARAVGEAARNTIYLSWEDAVNAAYERYLYLIELKKSQTAEKAESFGG